ncbi:TPA: hypothetical protein ACPPHS_001731 [Haemophilus influenzae]
MIEFVKFFAKLSLITFIVIGYLILLSIIDFSYILAFIGVYVAIFATCLVVAIIKENNRIKKLRIVEQDKNRVKYVIIN